jgi:lipopolysaccharide heptosyltransferase I
MKPLSFTTPPARILIIKPSAIGDIVHALPVLNLLRTHWPAAHISWVVSTACASLLEGHPQIDELIPFERRQFGKGWRKPSAALGLFHFMQSLRERQFDLVIDLQGLFRSGWMSWRTGAPVRVGPAEAREMGWIFYTHRVETGFPHGHAVDRYLKVADALGLGRTPARCVFATTDGDRASTAKLLPNDVHRYAVMLPGANWSTKRWPPEKFAALVEPLRQQYGLASIIAGGAGDAKLAARIPGALDLTGKTNLRQLVALLERADLVIGNDTGPMHIAAALDRPIVALYGPTNPDYTGPYGRLNTVVRHPIECSPCLSRHCSHKSCLRKLEADIVLEAVARQLRIVEHGDSSGRHPLHVLHSIVVTG